MTKSIEDLTAELSDLKAERKELSVKDKELSSMQTELEHLLLDRLGESGIESARTNAGTVSISRTIVPQVEDWEQVYDYIIDTNQPYLFYRRLNAASYRELLNLGTEIPGTKAFEQIKLNLRHT